MELQRVLERHSRLPVWCLSRANLRLIQAALDADTGQQPVAWEERDFLGNLAGLFELVNVRYMQESREAGPGGSITLAHLLRCWLRSNTGTATIGNLVQCLTLLRRLDILERLNTHHLVEYYHVGISYHQRDAGKASELAERLAEYQPAWRLELLDTRQAMAATEVSQRCFSCLLLVSKAYVDDRADYLRVLIEKKARSNYPAFCITLETGVMQAAGLPSSMRLFPPLAWWQLDVNFFRQLRQCMEHRERAVCQGRMMRAMIDA